MATLDDNDFRDLKKRIRRDPAARAEFKAWGLDKATWMAAFQAAENWFVGGFNAQPATSFKAAIGTETGSVTNTQTIQIGKVWMGWRYSRFMGT